MNPFRFNLSLRCSHPTLNAAHVADLIGFKPGILRSVGRPRMTPKGTLLTGINKKTFCVFQLADGQNNELVDELTKSNRHLRARKTAIDRFRKSGGTLEYFLGIFLEGNGVLVLDPGTTAACSALGLTLSLDMYPPDDA